ncbi:MAG: hypothetical protein Q9M36_13900 [Sulfurovum sp.]|nr:hypothetical protein [Sulfurovum sp.]
MKYIIDLIEDIRETISNNASYSVTAGLLKEDVNDSSKLIYAGEAALHTFVVDTERKVLQFSIDTKQKSLTIQALIPSLLILDMEAMMYRLSIDVNSEYQNMEIVGFGKNEEQKRYILFIKI